MRAVDADPSVGDAVSKTWLIRFDGVNMARVKCVVFVLLARAGLKFECQLGDVNVNGLGSTMWISTFRFVSMVFVVEIYCWDDLYFKLKYTIFFQNRSNC